ncbi:hypothetical protein BC936DRAFT_146538 [Jimgerdemannia flammicorona]|uniref:Anaphase-promoting complex subunit 1 C-terminal domain-containing protein n=1 Tax=Jimgerdemannia flammicorona TaxID=994334 RepID=A0A433D7G0_9FUNG|nr:hypothetical protein BC936DRAFT_146538 [Jimgerdemannia flammicorona]
MDKPEAIQVYLSLYQGQETLKTNPNVLTMWNIKLVLAYHEQGSLIGMHRGENKQEPLIRESFVEALRQEMDILLRLASLKDGDEDIHDDQRIASLKRYFTLFEFPRVSSTLNSKYFAMLGMYLMYNDVPGPDTLQELLQLIRNVGEEHVGPEVGMIRVMLQFTLPDLRWDVIEQIQKAILQRTIIVMYIVYRLVSYFYYNSEGLLCHMTIQCRHRDHAA